MTFYKIMIQLLTFTVFFFLSTFACSAAPAELQESDAKGVLTGQFIQSGKTPLANGRLYIYDKSVGPPSADRYVRVPDMMAALDNAGRFSLPIAAGTYFLSAVKMPEAGHMGPPDEGEPIYFKMDSKGEMQAYTVIPGKKTDAGIISTSVAYTRKQLPLAKDATLIEGTVTDGNNLPVAGAIIFVYGSPDILDKSLYVSEKTGSNGIFSLNVADGGTYYLRVRSEYGGGTPKEGELIHINGAKELVAVTLLKGEKRSDIRIQVKPVPERGTLYKGPLREKTRLGN